MNMSINKITSYFICMPFSHLNIITIRWGSYCQGNQSRTEQCSFSRHSSSTLIPAVFLATLSFAIKGMQTIPWFCFFRTSFCFSLCQRAQSSPQSFTWSVVFSKLTNLALNLMMLPLLPFNSLSLWSTSCPLVPMTVCPQCLAPSHTTCMAYPECEFQLSCEFTLEACDEFFNNSGSTLFIFK